MYEQLFEESPTIQQALQRLTEKRVAEVSQKVRQEAHQAGLQEGRQEGRQAGLLALQDLLVDSVEGRYPDLAELARERAGHFDQLDGLKRLIQQVMIAPDADAVRRHLEAGTVL